MHAEPTQVMVLLQGSKEAHLEYQQNSINKFIELGQVVQIGPEEQAPL